MKVATGPHILNEEPKDENNRITRLMDEMKAHLCALEERINQIGMTKKTKRNVPRKGLQSKTGDSLKGISGKEANSDS